MMTQNEGTMYVTIPSTICRSVMLFKLGNILISSTFFESGHTLFLSYKVPSISFQTIFVQAFKIIVDS